MRAWWKKAVAAAAVALLCVTMLPYVHGDDIEILRPVSTALANSWTAIQTFSATILQNGSRQGNFTTKSLTSGAAAVPFVRVTTAIGSQGTVVVEYSNEVTSSSGPNYQVFGGTIVFNFVNKTPGNITCTTGTPTESALAETAGGSTLTHTFSCADAGSNLLNLNFTDTSSLASVVANLIRYRVNIVGNSTFTVTAQ